MSKISKKQHVPVFVGSTFIDMNEYRKSAFQSLTQLETIVRGMEYFGSKPDAPLDVCLETVRSCSLYVGLFGMRYGSIPDGHDESMTHLEYLEAQKSELPSLIYIIDSENQPILPKFIEMGEGAEKLEMFKSSLQKRHTCSYFTTPSDLSAKLLHDIPVALSQIGAEVTEDLVDSSHNEAAQVIKDFYELPALYKGKEVLFEFKVGKYGFSASPPSTCDALGTTIGGTVRGYVEVVGLKSSYEIYAHGELAKIAVRLESNSTVRARGKTVFGKSYSSQWTDDGPIKEVEIEKGILVTEILDVAL